MTQQEILDYNKRCTEFLGWTNLNDESFPEYLDKVGNFYPLKELKFDSDWNWIMEVVEAIKEKTNFKTIDECSEDEWYATIGVTRLTITSKKQAVVEAINQFLIWFEQNKK